MADYSASNQLKLSELNAHRVGNDLPAITMKELISRESNGIRVDVGLPDESFDGLTFNPKFVIDRPSNKSVSQKLKSNQANMNALFDIRQDELAYVQDREFGTYENNLTGQTVNAEAEKIFAEQNQIRDALNTELVQKHNDSLKPTYSPGDKVSAAQMQNKTYGLGVNPGDETSFVDEVSDIHGRSEQNIESAAAAALAKEREIEEEIELFENKLKQQLAEDKIDRTAAATAAAVVSRETDKEIEKAIKVATAKQAEFDKIAKEKELALLRRQNETFQQNSQTYGLDGNKRLITPGNETLYIDTIADEAITGEGDTVGSLTAEIITEKADKADKAAQLQGTADIQKYLDDEQSNGKLGSTLPPQLGNGGIGYNSANKIVKTSNTATPLQQKMFDNEANYLKESGLAEQRARKETLEKLPSFADTRDGSLTGKDPFRFSTLAYPESITTDPQYGHFILFYVNVQNKTKYSYRGYNNDGDEIDVGDKYQTSKLDFVDDGSGRRPGSGGGSEYRMVVTEHTGAIEQGLASEVSYQKQQHLDGQLGSNHLRNNQVTLMKARKARAGIDTVLDLTTRITDSVAIYLPSAINDNVKAGYQDFNTGFAGFIALSGGKILRNIANNDFEGAARAFIGKGKDILLDLGKRAAIGAYGGLLSGDGVTNAFDKAFGQTVNPFIEVAFDSMGVRTFNYTFDFRPKSSRETEEVQAIIKLFRFHMVPEQKGSNHRYMTLPSTFDIHYMYQTNEASKENEFYSKIATCVLTGCDVDYTPDGVKSFESGAPTHITMALNFMETEMLTKEKINDGF